MARLVELAKELKRIRKAHRGRLHPAKVVESARNPKSPLHSQFTWDNTKAAEEHRLWQARQLIARVQVTVEVQGKEPVRVRAYHALRLERGGYRHMNEIVNSDDLRQSLLAEMADDLDRLKERYAALRGVLATKKVFAAIDEFTAAKQSLAAAGN